MIKDYKSLVGYELGDNRYDNVGRKEGEISKETKRCNDSPSTVSYMAYVIEKNTKAVGKEYEGFEIGD